MSAGPPGGDEIVDHDDALAPKRRVLVHLHFIVPHSSEEPATDAKKAGCGMADFLPGVIRD